MIDFYNQKFLITGATSGIGMAIAKMLNNHNGFVVLCGRNEDKLKKVQQSLNNPNFSELIIADLEKYFDIKNEFDQSITQSGPFHGMVNSAGIDITKPLKLTQTDDFNTLFKLNVTSPFELIKLLTSRKNFSKDGGSIVLLSSVMASFGEKGKIAYSTSKSAINGMVKSMAIELASKKIRVNSVLPGIVDTPLTEKLFSFLPNDAKTEIQKKHPLGFGEPEDVAALVCFLLSKQARWITGSEYYIDGGYHAS